MRALLPALFVVLLLNGCASSKPETDAALTPEAELTRLRADLDAAYAEIDRLRGRANTPQPAPVLTASQRGETVSIIPTDVLFESGSAQLSRGGLQRLAEVARTLKTRYAGREVRVEGYTDSQPIAEPLRAQFPSNWELSAARAAMVARHLQWTHDLDGAKMEVVGMSQYRPRASNQTEDGRQQNRYVRIAVLLDGATAAR